MLKSIIPLFAIIFSTIISYAEILRVLPETPALTALNIQNKVEPVRTRLTANPDSGSITVSYLIPNIRVMPDTTLYPGTYYWSLDGCGVSETPATPSFPHVMDVMELPGDATNIQLRIDAEEKTIFNSHTPTPARCPLPADGSGYHSLENVPPIPAPVLVKNNPSVKIDAITRYRDKVLVYVAFQPCSYIARLQRTNVSASITYTVSFDSQQSEANENSTGTIEVPEDYLIVTYEKYKNALQPFITWKKQCGSNVHMVYGDNWPSSSNYKEDQQLKRTAIKDAIKGVYEDNKNLMYVIFAGGCIELPGCEATYWAKRNEITLGVDPQSDYYYLCMDGEDDLQPDLISGRFMASDVDEMRTIVGKIVGYEKNTVQDEAFYDNVLHLAFFQDKAISGNGWSRPIDGVEDLSCVHTTEYLKESAVMNGKNVVRIYARTPTSVQPKYMVPAIPAEPELLPSDLRYGFKWGSTPSKISENINAGKLYALYCGHGDYRGWANPEYKEPFENLTDSLMLPVIFSYACETGRFVSNSLAATMLTCSKGGAVAVVAAEQSHMDPRGARMFRGMFNDFWPRDIETNLKWHTFDYGGITGTVTQSTVISSSKRNESDVERLTLGKTLYSGHRIMTIVTSNYTNKYDMECKELFHIFGDPGMVFHTQKPEVMTDVRFERTQSALGFQQAVLTLEEPAIIGYYNDKRESVSRFYGTSVLMPSSSTDSYTFTIQRYNRIPFTIKVKNGLVFTSAPLANPADNGTLNIVQTSPGYVQVSYALSNEELSGSSSRIELRDWSNSLIASDLCNDSAGEIIMESPRIQQGYYVVSLHEDGMEPVYKKIIIK